MECDAVVASGYKWLGGHGGVALAIMSPRLLEQIPFPGWMAADPFKFDATSVSLANDARLHAINNVVRLYRGSRGRN